MLSYILLAAAIAFSAPEKPAVDPDVKWRDYMQEVARQLGVTCTHCHDVKNFKRADKPTFQIAKLHMDVVHTLNAKFPNQLGDRKVDCYMCHRGKAKPDYREPPQLH